MDEGFSMDSTGSEGMTCKISHFIMQLIVVGKDKTTKRAGKATVHGELLTTAITVRRKVRRGLGIAEIEGILLGTLGQRVLCHGEEKQGILVNQAPVA